MEGLVWLPCKMRGLGHRSKNLWFNCAFSCVILGFARFGFTPFWNQWTQHHLVIGAKMRRFFQGVFAMFKGWLCGTASTPLSFPQKFLRSEDDILNESEEDELSDEVRCVFFCWWLWLFLVFCLYLKIYLKDKDSIQADNTFSDKHTDTMLELTNVFGFICLWFLAPVWGHNPAAEPSGHWRFGTSPAR